MPLPSKALHMLLRTRKLLDGAAVVAEDIPIASVVIKCISFTVNQWTEKKFDVRMNRLIERLFPGLSPTKWTFVAEEVSRRVTVVFADDVEALHSGTEDKRSRVKNWFRNKCAEYGLAHLTTNADDAVVMMALQLALVVTCVPPRLDYTELAHFLVGKPAPRAAASVVSAHALISFHVVRHRCSSVIVTLPLYAGSSVFRFFLRL